MHVAIILKTSDHGMHVLPVIDELRRRGHLVTAVIPSHPGRFRTSLQQRGVAIVDSAFDFNFKAAAATAVGLFRLRRQIRALSPDVVHYFVYASALAARFATIFTPARRVHMVIGSLYLDSRLIRKIERLLVRLDHVTICGCADTARRYRELGRSIEKTPIIRHGANVRNYAPTDSRGRSEAKRRLGVDVSTFVVVMIAYVYAPKRLVFKGIGIKGHDVLLRAWKRFQRDSPDSHLFLVGGGYGEGGEDHRKELIAKFAVESDPSITWVGSVPDVRQYYIAADISVSPSYSESNGAVREAAPMGVPSIVSDAGGLPEGVSADSGWIVPAGDSDAIVVALRAAETDHHSGRLNGRREAAREIGCQLFDEEREAMKAADVIESVALMSERGGDRTSGRRAAFKV